MNAAPACLIGLDEPEIAAIQNRVKEPLIVHPTLPKILIKDGELFVEATSGFNMRHVSKVVFHGIFENDLDTLAGLALWGGPCLPNAQAMMDCRLKLPCLVRALKHTNFGRPHRGFAASGVDYPTDIERVAKWGNWHCGENKARFEKHWLANEPTIIEPYLDGNAVRVVVIGNQHWQINLDGDAWLKSIHHPNACLTEPDHGLVEDTRSVANGFGLEIAANDYIITRDGEPHLLEVNHIPNVTRFPEIWAAYESYVVEWLAS